MGKLLLLSTLIVGIAIGLRFSLKTLQPNLFLAICDYLYSIGPKWIFGSIRISDETTELPFAGIDSDADLNPHLVLPSCMRYPFHTTQLEKHVHLSLLGYVFKIPPNDHIFGVNGSSAAITGCDATHRILGEKELSRYALDGVETHVVADLLRWIQLLSLRYQCIGHLPGVYFHPMGDPTTYMQSIHAAWRQIVQDQVILLAVFPRCQIENGDKTVAYVTCPDEIRPNGERVQRSPRLLVESSRRNPRCACASIDSARPPVTLLNYPHCQPTSSRCLSSESS